MTPRQPVPAPLYDAAFRVLCGIGTAADKRDVLAAVPTHTLPLDAATEIIGHAARYGRLPSALPVPLPQTGEIVMVPLEWFTEEGILTAHSNTTEDDGVPLSYEIEEIDRGVWRASFEGNIFHTGSLQECVEACDKFDVADAQAEATTTGLNRGPHESHD